MPLLNRSYEQLPAAALGRRLKGAIDVGLLDHKWLVLLLLFLLLLLLLLAVLPPPLLVGEKPLLHRPEGTAVGEKPGLRGPEVPLGE